MKIVWMNGCFDILHYAHFKMIRVGVDIGDELYIGIDSDRRIKESKGNDRPFHTEQQRKFNLESIQGVSKVIIFDSDSDLEMYMDLLHPDIFVIGSEYKNKNIVGKRYVKHIYFFDRQEDFSTTKILENNLLG